MSIESTPHVLVVDDYERIADSLARILNIHGFRAVPTYSGERAVQLAATQPFDHLISDVVMHPINGIEAAIAIRGLLPHCKILLTSGNNRTSRLLLEAQAQGHDFMVLAKPIYPELILDILRNNQ